MRVSSCIRHVKPRDAKQIANIYNHYVTHSTATFEVSTVSDAEMAKRIVQTTKKYPWVVYDDGHIRGYAYVTAWKKRKAYYRTGEVTVYVDAKNEKKGVGSALYDVLLIKARDVGLHVLLAGISLPNDASVAIHEKFGFKKVGVMKQVGFKFGRWIDVGYWQLELEERQHRKQLSACL